MPVTFRCYQEVIGIKLCDPQVMLTSVQLGWITSLMRCSAVAPVGSALEGKARGKKFHFSNSLCSSVDRMVLVVRDGNE